VKEKFEKVRVSIELNERQKYILEKIKSQGFIKSKEIQEKFNVTRDTANRDLNYLIKMKLIKREGKGKKVKYIFIK
jgi:DeoR/GlpR family transcriptional regulator of sugar metabolism